MPFPCTIFIPCTFGGPLSIHSIGSLKLHHSSSEVISIKIKSADQCVFNSVWATMGLGGKEE